MVRPVRILIDGPSGSGKTTLANTYKDEGFLVLHMDDWYPGWDGLDAASRIAEQLLSGELEAYPRWDWVNNRVAEWVPVDPNRHWVLEGCGAITKVSASLADQRIWLEMEPQEARRRGLARDGDTFLPWWQMWNEQEQVHWERNRPQELADVVLDGHELRRPDLPPRPGPALN